MASKLRRGMEVVVLTGRERGKSGKILRLDREKNRVVVEGVNMVKRATRPSATNQAGGFVEKEAALHASNVAAVDPKTRKAVRIGFDKAGERKIRVGRGSNASGEALAEGDK